MLTTKLESFSDLVHRDTESPFTFRVDVKLGKDSETKFFAYTNDIPLHVKAGWGTRRGLSAPGNIYTSAISNLTDGQWVTRKILQIWIMGQVNNLF